MKRRLIGLAAVTLGIWLTSFSLKQDSTVASYYWFNLNPGTGEAIPIQWLQYQSGCPAYCGNFGITPYCMGGYTGYTGTGPYYAAGIEVLLTRQYPTFLPH